ncbi:hypothetical protein GPUN_1439 [Glaciecola punicea ACAM 611]|uniref:Uncharacterized protein n=1 Tax=Glaciecola punicea ACAM 611 TaxID=1121923 RepID=H5TB86_9ALTE|nr:hypothetical protein GPUN_1439 [Glaciecola punicea ACAM 611]
MIAYIISDEKYNRAKSSLLAQEIENLHNYSNRFTRLCI